MGAHIYGHAGDEICHAAVYHRLSARRTVQVHGARGNHPAPGPESWRAWGRTPPAEAAAHAASARVTPGRTAGRSWPARPRCIRRKPGAVPGPGPETAQILTGARAAGRLCPALTAASRYALAIDVGTTTLAAYLLWTGTTGAVQLAGASSLNPQRQYGADVISRIQLALDGRAARPCAAAWDRRPGSA